MPTLERQRQMATWARTVAPCDWTTESKDATRDADAGVAREEQWLSDDRRKTDAHIREHNKILFRRARDRLHQLASHKFGSLKAMIKDIKSSGSITLDEFSTALKRRKLENVFPRDYQRVVFEAMDHSYDEKMHVDDLLKVLNPDMDQYEEPIITVPLPEDGDLNAGDGRLDAAHLVDKPLLPESLQDVKNKVVDAVFEKARNDKGEDGVADHKAYLMNAFKQWDTDMSGKLDPDEMIMALGPKHLCLPVDATDLKALVDFVAKDGGPVSYKEFVRVLEFTDIEPDYNPFFDHRNRDLLALKRLSEAPWKWQNPSWDEKALAPDHDIPPGDEPDRDDDDDDETKPYIRPLFTSQDIKKYNSTRSGPTEAQPALRPATSSGDVFADLRAANLRRLQSICPRFVPPPPTDWTRTGCGGDGVNCRSGLYLPTAERFVTTSQAYFKPLRYGPGHTVARDAVSDAQKHADGVKRRAQMKKLRNLRMEKDSAARQRKREEMLFMNEQQKLQKKVRFVVRRVAHPVFRRLRRCTTTTARRTARTSACFDGARPRSCKNGPTSTCTRACGADRRTTCSTLRIGRRVGPRRGLRRSSSASRTRTSPRVSGKNVSSRRVPSFWASWGAGRRDGARPART